MQRVWGPEQSTFAVVCCGCVMCPSRFCGEKGTGASLGKGLGPQPTHCIPLALPLVTYSGCDFAEKG